MANLKPVAPSTPDYYADLQIAHNATSVQIRQAFKQLALTCHPDKLAKGKDIDAAEFRKVKDAYDFLSDNVKRANYDSTYDCLQTQWQVYRSRDALWRQNQQTRATNLEGQAKKARARRAREQADAAKAKQQAEAARLAAAEAEAKRAREILREKKELAAAERSRVAAERAQRDNKRAAEERLREAEEADRQTRAAEERDAWNAVMLEKLQILFENYEREQEQERKVNERKKREEDAEARSKVAAERAQMMYAEQAKKRMQDDARARGAAQRDADANKKTTTEAQIDVLTWELARLEVEEEAQRQRKSQTQQESDRERRRRATNTTLLKALLECMTARMHAESTREYASWSDQPHAPCEEENLRPQTAKPAGGAARYVPPRTAGSDSLWQDRVRSAKATGGADKTLYRAGQRSWRAG